jgi:exosortase/archaeosortase family protein
VDSLTRFWFEETSPLGYQILIPLGALAIGYRRRTEIAHTYAELGQYFPDPTHPKRRGNELLIFLGTLFLVASLMAQFPPIGVVGMIVVLAGIIHLIYGPFVLGTLRVPLAYLLLAVPLPQSLLAWLTGVGQRIAIGFTAQILQILHVETALRAPNLILPSGYLFEVTSAFSGLPILLPAGALLILTAVLRRYRLRITLIGLILTGAIGIILNMFRVLTIALVGNSNGWLGDRLHASPVWPFALLTFYLVDRVARQLARRQMLKEEATA